jgi:hypothetical protein
MAAKNRKFKNSVCVRLEAIDDSLQVMSKLLSGNGDPSKGLCVRVDRLEQSYKFSGKLFYGLIGVVLAPEIILAVIWYF